MASQRHGTFCNMAYASAVLVGTVRCELRAAELVRGRDRAIDAAGHFEQAVCLSEAGSKGLASVVGRAEFALLNSHSAEHPLQGTPPRSRVFNVSCPRHLVGYRR